MAKVYESISEHVQKFIETQHLFFVATAPLNPEGHVNLSPKGLGCLRVLSPNRVAYVDLIGSGNETSAHLHENGRITFMFCAFDGPPNIVRLYGIGRVILPADDEWSALSAQFPQYSTTRQIITADISRVSTSCGHMVPLMDFVEERDTWVKWAAQKNPETLVEYQCEKNAVSIDGLPTPLGIELVKK